MPALSTDLAEMESNRRASAAVPGCHGTVLETIKLAGIRLEPQSWRDLLQNYHAKVTC